MLNSIVFMGVTVAIVWVIYWLTVNDRAGNTGRTKGLFAMKEPSGGSDAERSSPRDSGRNA